MGDAKSMFEQALDNLATHASEEFSKPEFQRAVAGQ